MALPLFLLCYSMMLATISYVQKRRLLAKPLPYHRASRNCGYDLHILQGPFLGRMISAAND
jgi:hypothetical protein